MCFFFATRNIVWYLTIFTFSVELERGKSGGLLLSPELHVLPLLSRMWSREAGLQSWDIMRDLTGVRVLQRLLWEKKKQNRKKKETRCQDLGDLGKDSKVEKDLRTLGVWGEVICFRDIWFEFLKVSWIEKSHVKSLTEENIENVVSSAFASVKMPYETGKAVTTLINNHRCNVWSHHAFGRELFLS